MNIKTACKDTLIQTSATKLVSEEGVDLHLGLKILVQDKISLYFFYNAKSPLR